MVINSAEKKGSSKTSYYPENEKVGDSVIEPVTLPIVIGTL